MLRLWACFKLANGFFHLYAVEALGVDCTLNEEHGRQFLVVAWGKSGVEAGEGEHVDFVVALKELGGLGGKVGKHLLLAGVVKAVIVVADWGDVGL